MHLVTSRTDINKKDRPLQRSLLLSDKNIQSIKAQTHIINIDSNNMNHMKRSCISNLDGTPRTNTLSIKSNISNQPPLQNSNYLPSNTNNYYSSEVRMQEPYQLIHHKQPSNLVNMKHSHSIAQNNEN